MDELRDVLLCDGLEKAFLGLCYRFGQEPIAVYDKDRIIRIFMERDGMTAEDAEEFFEFNVIGAWVGDRTPAFVSRMTMKQFEGLLGP